MVDSHRFETSQPAPPKAGDPIGDLINRLSHGIAPEAPHRSHNWQTTVSPEPANPAARAALPAASIVGDHVPKGSPDPAARSAVIVDLNRRMTHVFQMNPLSGRVEEVLAVPDAPGKASTPTPPDRYTVIERRENPSWTDPKTLRTVPGGPDNPLGPRALRLSNSQGEWTNIEMHGTNRPGSIGSDSSHGCIRHRNGDIMRLYPLVHRGSAVYLTHRYEPSRLLRDADFR